MIVSPKVDQISHKYNEKYNTENQLTKKTVLIFECFVNVTKHVARIKAAENDIKMIFG